MAQHSDAGALVSLSVLIGLWSASSYVGCFIWAVERVYPVAKPPSFLHALRRQLLFAAIILVLLAVMGFIAVVSGPVAKAVGDGLGLGHAVLPSTGRPAGRRCWRPPCCCSTCSTWPPPTCSTAAS